MKKIMFFVAALILMGTAAPVQAAVPALDLKDQPITWECQDGGIWYGWFYHDLYESSPVKVSVAYMEGYGITDITIDHWAYRVLSYTGDIRVYTYPNITLVARDLVMEVEYNGVSGYSFSYNDELYDDYDG